MCCIDRLKPHRIAVCRSYIIDRGIMAHSGYTHILTACPKAVTDNINPILVFESHKAPLRRTARDKQQLWAACQPTRIFVSLDLYLFNQIRRVILRAVDLAANRIGFHKTVGVRQGHRLNLDYISEVRVEPSGVIFRLNNNRHAVVYTVSYTHLTMT